VPHIMGWDIGKSENGRTVLALRRGCCKRHDEINRQRDAFEETWARLTISWLGGTLDPAKNRLLSAYLLY
jgi:hypothetical protein